MNELKKTLFRAKVGSEFSGVSSSSLLNLIKTVQSEVGVGLPQIVEAASYSMAMVVRYALGLSAMEGRVTALVRDSLCGMVALATLRHLANAGAQCQIAVANDLKKPSEEFSRQLKPLLHSKTPLLTLEDPKQIDEIIHLLSSSHNIICGLFQLEDYATYQPADGLIELLNEIETPVHIVQAPIGINVETGEPGPLPLFASSTLSLGAPLSGLFNGRDYVGRHYLCDISIPPELYNQSGVTIAPLFAEQPVVQIFPVVPEDEMLNL